MFEIGVFTLGIYSKQAFRNKCSLSPKNVLVTCMCCPLTPQLCRFTTPIPHLAIYSGISDPPCASPCLSLPATAPACPSPISVALDSASASEGTGPSAPGPPEGQAPRSGVALSLRRLLRRGCAPSSVFASLSPKCHSAAGTSSRVQPISLDQPSQAPPRRITR